MEGDDERRGETEACESVSRVATTWLQGNPSTRSAPWRLGTERSAHPATLSDGSDFDFASRSKLVRLSSRESYLFAYRIGSASARLRSAVGFRLRERENVSTFFGAR